MISFQTREGASLKSKPVLLFEKTPEVKLAKRNEKAPLYYVLPAGNMKMG